MFCVYKLWMLVHNSSSLASYILTRDSSCDKVIFVRFEVLAVVMMQVQVFLVLLCSHILFLHNVVYPFPTIFCISSLLGLFILFMACATLIYLCLNFLCLKRNSVSICNTFKICLCPSSCEGRWGRCTEPGTAGLWFLALP